jgi:hypothetical protein
MNESREIRIRKGVRGTVLVLGTLAVASIVIGMLPGHELYSGGALTQRRSAGGSSFVQYIAWLIAPGIGAWIHPRMGITVLWTVLGWIGTLAYLVVTFGEWHVHSQLHLRLWPAEVLPYVAVPLIGTILLVMPAVALVVAIATTIADRRTLALADVEPPVARIHREKRSSPGA